MTPDSIISHGICFKRGPVSPKLPKEGGTKEGMSSHRNIHLSHTVTDLLVETPLNLPLTLYCGV